MISALVSRALGQTRKDDRLVADLAVDLVADVAGHDVELAGLVAGLVAVGLAGHDAGIAAVDLADLVVHCHEGFLDEVAVLGTLGLEARDVGLPLVDRSLQCRHLRLKKNTLIS